MQYYSFPFSLMVVERFTKSNVRGWDIFRKNLDDFYLEDLVQVFQTSQIKWNILKKIIKLLERDPRPDYYTHVKLKELYRYFEPYVVQEKSRKGLTPYSGYMYPSPAPEKGAGP